MQRIGTRELKNKLSRYLRAVKTGQTLVITARGKAIAKLIPTRDTPSEKDLVWERLEELEAQGYIRLGRGKLRKVRPVKIKGAPASQTIIEDRR